MGKQIQTLIYERKREFLEYLIDKGYGLVQTRYLEKKYVIFAKDKKDIDEAFLKEWQVCTSEMSVINRLKIIEKMHGQDYVGDDGKLVDLSFATVIEEEKRINRGRIYFQNGFSHTLSEEDSKVANAVYAEAKKWIKKNIPYRVVPYLINDVVLDVKIYVEDYIYDLIVNKGYDWY